MRHLIGADKRIYGRYDRILKNDDKNDSNDEEAVIGNDALVTSLVPWKLFQRLFYCFSCSLVG